MKKRFVPYKKGDKEYIADNDCIQSYGFDGLCEMLNEFNDENKELKKENEQLKQKIQRWKTLYEIKDAEVTARVDALNKVCNYYLNEVLFKSDTDPNKAVKEVINEILNTEVEW